MLARTERSDSLFTDLLRFTPDKQNPKVRENFFTAALGGVLREDLTFAREFVRLLNGDRGTIGRSAIVIGRASIETVPWSSGRAIINGVNYGCYPDLELRVSSAQGDTYRLATEIKLGAPEGKTSDGVGQLEKYLGMQEIDGIAYVRGFARDMPDVQHPRYLRPADKRDHFLWADVYPLVERGAERRTCPALHRGLRGLMDAEDFKPAHPWLPDLHAAPTRKELMAARGAFETYWEPTRQHFLSAYSGQPGWNVRTVKQNGEMVWRMGHEGVFKASFNPFFVPGAARLWLYPATSRILAALVRELRCAVLDKTPRWCGMAVRESRTSILGVSVTVPYRTLLKGLSSADGLGRRLRDFSVDLLTCAFTIADRAAAR